jgi:hypothetical protein
MACETKVQLLAELSSATLAHAPQTALLSAMAATSDHDSFSETRRDCEQTERTYEVAKAAFDSHRSEHG